MSFRDMAFVFTPTLDSKEPRSARKIHIRRLYDVMHMCIQKNDFDRATRAWTVLAHCKEINAQAKWSTSLHILSAKNPEDPQKAVEFLRVMMLQHPEDREPILTEMILCLITAEQHRDALDELELYLPSFPYQDNAVLHVYAGLLSMYIGQRTSGPSQFDPALLRSAQTYFERAKVLDPNNSTVESFLQKIQKLNGGVPQPTTEREESDDDGLEVTSDRPKQKRVRTERKSKNSIFD
ncbi:RNA polymerase I-specific transcription initiation factor rrn11 [Mycena sanguinolenta]|uniref:RNA polymerase I-specific transcription initiation factor rrn11 n=1 Tax=Mycena sanguinolenta TaxID=230812 RepID=A0A8H6YAM6_9AGAR|nr:RNA polymerase I-specific transcription initiation factor rrn11 [Mycena sanguinolenta]